MQIDGYGSGHLDNWPSTKKDIFIDRYMNDLTDQELFLVRERQRQTIAFSQTILVSIDLLYISGYTFMSEFDL